MKLFVLPLVLMLALIPSVWAGNTFDPETGILEMDVLKSSDGATYTGLEVRILDFELIDYNVAVEVPRPPEDGGGGGVGILPNGHTCFLDETPGCEPNPAWQGLNPDLYPDPDPDPEPDPGTPCGFGPYRPNCQE